jgi:hypothetical protein
VDKQDRIKEIIANAKELVDFADFGEGISSEWISKAEKRLKIKLPESYKWWLSNYSGGEIAGDEVYSIYGIDFDEVVGGDIVYMHELNSKNNSFGSDKLVIFEPIDSVFYFDLDSQRDDSEMDIYELHSNTLFASDFYQFLEKIILEKYK